jgi:hypothetical protein
MQHDNARSRGSIPWLKKMVGDDTSSTERLDRAGKQSGGILPAGELSRCRTSVGGEPLPFRRIADQTTQCL